MNWVDWTFWQWSAAAAAGVFIGVSKCGLAGVGMLAVLLMASIMPARESTGVVLPLLICADLFAVLAFRKHAVWSHITRLLIPTAAGILAGYFLMGVVPDGMFRPVIGVIVLLMTGIQAMRKVRPQLFLELPHSAPFAWFIGIFSGITTMMANAAGPVMSLYLLVRGLPKYELVATGAWFFFIVNISKLPFSYDLGLIGAPSLLLNALLVPCVLAGIFLGRKLIAAIPQNIFENLLLILAALAAIRLIWS